MAGDVAEAMLDGTLCEICGEFLGEPTGYPVRCTDCKNKPERLPTYRSFFEHQNPKAMILCPVCHKRVKEMGLGHHVKDAHPESQQVMKYNHAARRKTPGGE